MWLSLTGAERKTAETALQHENAEMKQKVSLPFSLFSGLDIFSHFSDHCLGEES
jgi:hypothetical protein